jgi:sec-independent protein translocase protein TatB
MFDFAWSEIALIGVVALVAIGPKDMPVAIRAISDTLKKLRRMAGEFQGHVDEMIREADLGDAKATFDELRGMNPKAMLQRAVDPDGTMRSAFADPFKNHPVPTPASATTSAPRLDQSGAIEVSSALVTPAPGNAPAFIPPGATPPAPIQPDHQPAPAFIPPSADQGH